MPRCILCLNDLRAPSVEHIFPEAVGGTLITDQVCKPCNDYLGSAVDAPFVNSFLVQLIRYAHGIEGKAGVPNPLREGVLEADADQRVHLQEGEAGHLEPLLLPRVERSDDKVRIAVDASQKGQLVGIANKVLTRKGLPPLTETDVETNLQRHNLGQAAIAIPFKQDLAAPHRGMIKIAYELGVRWLGAPFLDDPEAELLRRCLLDREYSGPDPKKHPIKGRIGFANEIPGAMDAWASAEPRANIAFTQSSGATIACCFQVLGAFRGCVVLSNDAGRYPTYEHMFFAQDPVTKTKRESTFLDECARLDDGGTLESFLDEQGA